MIKWREGKAGFVGAAKRLIQGVFSSSYTLTSVAPIVPKDGIGVISRIINRGASISSTMTSSGLGVSSTINQVTSLTSWIDARAESMKSTITDQGISVRSDT